MPRGNGHLIPTSAPPDLWAGLKPLARQMRRAPTSAEDALWQRLRRRQIAGMKFRRQHAIERFIVDFYCPEAGLIVEVDGPVHEYTAAEDAIRQEYLESLGLRVLRFDNDKVYSEIESVVEVIRAAVQREDKPHP